MSKQTMGEFLALLRKANGFTQQDVADKLNISNRTLSSWETDRTTPDVLLLPAIADLYGVTVDELLRCERSATENGNKEISDKAKNSARKHRLGKFSAKSLLLSCLGCFGAVMIALSFIFWMYASCPTWLFILLIVLSACDIVVCGVILFYLYYNAKVAEGLILKEDYTEEKKPYALALKRKSAMFFLFCALPLALFAIAMIIATIIINPYNYEILGVTINVIGAYAATICTTGGLGIALLISYLVYSNINFINLANEKQAETHKHNSKLLGKTVGFGAIPVGIFLLIMGILNSVFPTTYSAYVGADTPEDFKRQMQTLEIKKYSGFYIDCGKPVGEYYLNFPEEYEPGLYDLGNGFCGLSNYYADSETWAILLLKEEGNIPEKNEYGEYDDSYFYDSFILCETYTDFGIKYVNVACNYTIYNDSVLGLTIETELKARRYRGKYEFGAEDTIDASLTSFYLFLFATGVTTITCTAIYFTKRKKQSFEF
ncbi:MAG: helix-turn-helix domain-containing protein [Clostridia bacterium]|nr:helix-turn-helix domain-containing protein [Clostridia bacterium]